ncbi:hypothetical protein LXM94_23410 [Rhizobium sp. TRM95111]|uniref:hypothetical protein n=1 Tax=Rhizobium alarense TaxID=2846851 RepID=UPI001F31FC14|nr:hypothetical protein [Rhizobium alarense]MCF3642918.1 hypothetical protein [Rhizobium alarense]
MAKVTVALSKSYEAHGKIFNSVVLREPTYADIFLSGLGRPQELQSGGNGKVMLLTYPETVDGYVQRLASEPPAECLLDLNAVDSMRVEKAICDFFLVPTSPATSPPTSSSGSDGTAPGSSA